MIRRVSMFALVSLFAAPAFAQTGVSDDRVSVPDGPGSVEGLGDNATFDGNMGLMSYGVAFELPRGFVGATPSLSASYNGGSGNTVVGVGWRLAVDSIERLTLRGLPRYDADDEFAANASEQLVRVATSGADATYRARSEAAFVRYTWHSTGAAGYWSAEYPDGSVGYFGATSTGTVVPEARLVDSNGHVFRYHLVERVDVFGHRIRYRYTTVASSPYLTSIEYVHDAGGTPRYVVDLAYQARTDIVSDCKPGFEERISQRLASVTVSANGEQIRSYVLGYQADGPSGGLSRLISVDRYGQHGGHYPAGFTFGYSQALGGVCGAGTSCASPFVVSMGSLPTGGAIGAGDATLVDINGDSLPDVVDATNVGAHVFVMNRLDSEGHSSFSPTTRSSTTGTRSAFQLSLPNVEPLDVDGDGFADLVNTLTGNVLCNDASGDWKTTGCVPPSGFGFVLAGGQTGVRFLDVDGDRRIDVLRTTSANLIEVWRNTGDGFQALVSPDPIGAAFDVDHLVLADMNGDNLLDPVAIDPTGAIRYRANLGRGQWLDWRDMTAPALSASQRDSVELEDLNGDGMDDLVIVSPTSIEYALNHAGSSFGAFVSIDSSTVPALPARSPTTTVLYADMNGNGSADVVWVQSSGAVAYLELFPVPPNLLSRIENRLGHVQAITYGTAAGERASSASAWAYPLGIPANVVATADEWTTLTGGDDGVGLHELTQYHYRDGFYDGVEKQFRGFGRVEAVAPRDASSDDQEAGRSVSTFDVGSADPYRAGKLLTVARFSGDGAAERAIDEVRRSYADCALAEVPASGLLLPVRFVCELSTTTVAMEGAATAEWATMRVERTYDGYGQVSLEANRGVVTRGSPESPQSCGSCVRDAASFGEACGATCLGDEHFVETQYVSPGASTGGRWIVGKPQVVRHYASVGGASDETRTYYDGAAFVGLPLGSLSRGVASRVSARRTSDDASFVDVDRIATDANGMTTATLDANASVADPTTHRRDYAYDATGMRVVRADIHVVSPEGKPYVVRREVTYDPAFDEPTEVTAFMVVEGATNRSARNPTRVRYDEFARRIAIIQPGDTDAAPTLEYVWELANPVSRIVEHRRTARGGVADLEKITCIDGRGRTSQTRTRIDADRYQIDGFVVLNSRGAQVRAYQPFVATSGSCDASAPSAVRFEQVRYDAAFREVLRTRPDATLHGSNSTTATAYAPLSISTFDENDRDASSPFESTPTVVHHDGLGRTVAVERLLTSAGPGAFTRAEYDALGHLSTVVDPTGHRKVQTLDLIGRVLSIDDPSSGMTTVTHDAVGNVLSRTDARGVSTLFEYDGANRLTADWEASDRAGTEVRRRYDIDGVCDAADCSNAAGRPIEVTYPVASSVAALLGGAAFGMDHFGYDARGQSAYEARTIGGHALVTRLTYDDAGRMLEEQFPDGRTLTHAYDSAARPVAISGVIANIAYDDRGAPSQVEHVSGALDTWSHDVLGRLSERNTSASNDVALADVSYTRDRVGNITHLTDEAATPDGWEHLDATFTYDAWYRVVGSEFAGRGGASELQTRAYDLLDDLLHLSTSAAGTSASELGDLTYEDARPNALLSANGVAYRSDAAGNLIARDTVLFDWDHHGRLVRARRGDATIASFSYANGAERVASVEGSSVTIYAGRDFEVRDGISVIYARVGDNRVARLESDALAATLLGDVAPVGALDAHVDAADAWIAYASGENILAATEAPADPRVILRASARRLLAGAGDDHVALHSDSLGSLVASTDAEGLERGRRRFHLSDGEDRLSGFVDVYGFSGQEEFPSLGLVRFEHRWLDPITQRWATPDPAFEAVSELTASRASPIENRYSYVGHDFINHTDPTGLEPHGGGGGGGAAANHGGAHPYANAGAAHAGNVPATHAPAAPAASANPGGGHAQGGGQGSHAAVINGAPGEGQGFTGVFDRTTGNVHLQPSAVDPQGRQGWVTRSGGHVEVSRNLRGQREDHVGFAVITRADNSLQITWLSGYLNGPTRQAPMADRASIVRAVRTATGREVSE